MQRAERILGVENTTSNRGGSAFPPLLVRALRGLHATLSTTASTQGSTTATTQAGNPVPVTGSTLGCGRDLHITR